jgi:hypothetical protein
MTRLVYFRKYLPIVVWAINRSIFKNNFNVDLQVNNSEKFESSHQNITKIISLNISQVQKEMHQLKT